MSETVLSLVSDFTDEADMRINESYIETKHYRVDARKDAGG